jgi:hypothetical protein
VTAFTLSISAPSEEHRTIAAVTIALEMEIAFPFFFFNGSVIAASAVLRV